MKSTVYEAKPQKVRIIIAEYGYEPFLATTEQCIEASISGKL